MFLGAWAYFHYTTTFGAGQGKNSRIDRAGQYIEGEKVAERTGIMLDPKIRFELKDEPEDEMPRRLPVAVTVEHSLSFFEAVQEIKNAGSSPSSRYYSLLDPWIYHPSEWVQVALLEAADLWDDSSIGKLAGLKLYARAVEKANDAGEVWTPLLDALSASEVWPQKWWDADEVDTPEYRELADQAMGREEYIEEKLWPLLEPEDLPEVARKTRSEYLLSSAIIDFENISVEFLKEAISRFPSMLTMASLRTTALPDGVLDYLLEEVTRETVEIIKRNPSPRFKRSHEAFGFDDVFASLVERGGKLNRLQLGRIIEAFEDNKEEIVRDREAKDLRGQNKLPEQPEDGWKDQIRWLVPLQILRSQAMSVGDTKAAEAYIEVARDVMAEEVIADIFRTGYDGTLLTITPDLAKRALTVLGNDKTLLENLVEHPSLVEDNEIRAAMLESESMVVYKELILEEGLEKEEFVSLFDKIQAIDPGATLYVVAQIPRTCERLLEVRHMTPLLKHPDRKLRLFALEWIARLHERDGRAVEQPEKVDRKERQGNNGRK